MTLDKTTTAKVMSLFHTLKHLGINKITISKVDADKLAAALSNVFTPMSIEEHEAYVPEPNEVGFIMGVRVCVND